MALTCTRSKILESIAAANLLQFLNDHKLISKQQHDFLKKHSTTINLLESVKDWNLSISNLQSVVVAYIDFQRAFDSISHPKLLHKLLSYGIHGNLLFLIASFVSNLFQQVRVGSLLSKSCVVTSGVPQAFTTIDLATAKIAYDITWQ